MGVGISPERGGRVERAAGGRPERTPEPETELLVGRVTETDVLSGRRPEPASASEREPGAWPASAGTVTAGASSLTRTVPVRPLFNDGPVFDDGPATELLPGVAPDPGRPLPASWEDSGEPSVGHDRHEITIQLDSASRADDVPGKDVPASADVSDGPVFVDESGRRSRRFRRLGMLVAVACAVYAVVIVATLLSGNSNAPWLPVPGQEEDTPAGQVETSPLPAQSVKPSGTGAATAPGAVATAADGTTPSPGSTATAGASAEATATGASGDPEPSTSPTKKPNPGVTTKNPDPDPEPTSSADGQPTPSAPATTPGSTAAPTESTGTTGSTGAGTGTE
jgi:hypothetical protein